MKSEKLFLKVPYSEKDSAKSLGAKWDPKLKLWFCEGALAEFNKFYKWLPDATVLVFNEFYIIEGHRICYHCHKNIPIIGLGIGKHTLVPDDDDYSIEDPDTDFEDDNEIHLAWFQSESDVPPLLRRFLSKYYFVRTQYSKTIDGKTYANYCPYCKVLQGNHFVFDEPNSPLVAIPDESTLKDKIQKLHIHAIAINEALPLNVDIGYGSEDWSYSAYATFDRITLSPAGKAQVSYAELFDL